MAAGTGSRGFEEFFAKVTIGFSVVALGLGGLFGLLQLVNRTPFLRLPSLLEVSPSTYYTALTAHGVLLAIVFTTFWIVGFTAFLAPRILKVPMSKPLLSAALVMMFAGTIMAAAAILTGRANVLYTFHYPMTAHPAFYLGAALLILGSWLVAFALFKQYLEWRRANQDKGIPVPIFGLLTTYIVWLEATIPIVINVLKNHIPVSLGIVSGVDALEARTWFWFFGHPLVYFWILPAVTLWYYLIPKRLGVKLFSESMAKVAFVLFILASTPVGLHHQFVDPGISAAYKFMQMVTTFIVASPSMLTAFNILATLERAGRARGGGILSWVTKLPWKDPVFAGLTLAFLVFGMGGITGIINASYQLNIVVHNTTFVVGHFHQTVGTAVALSFMAVTYALLTDLYGRKIPSLRLALAHPYLWAIGMILFSTGFYIAGVAGAPRRTYNIEYGGLIPDTWVTGSYIALVGGLTFWTAGAIFVAMTLYALLFKPSRGVELPTFKIGNPHDNPTPRHHILDNIKLWVVLAAMLIVAGYAPVMIQLYSAGLSPTPPIFRP